MVPYHAFVFQAELTIEVDGELCLKINGTVWSMEPKWCCKLHELSNFYTEESETQYCNRKNHQGEVVGRCKIKEGEEWRRGDCFILQLFTPSCSS